MVVVGGSVTTTGASVDGVGVVGRAEGCQDGNTVGCQVGDTEESSDGVPLGTIVGCSEGDM